MCWDFRTVFVSLLTLSGFIHGFNTAKEKESASGRYFFAQKKEKQQSLSNINLFLSVITLFPVSSDIPLTEN